MTDITNLMHSLKAAAEKAAIEKWQVKRNGPGEYGVMVKGSLVKRSGWSTHRPVADEVVDKNTADFIALANPANILALVEALEKAQQLATQQGNIACALFDEVTAQRQRIAQLEEAEQQLCAENVTLDARAELAERQLAELESRTVTVKLPAELYTIGELIRTQDNRITDQPMFVVFQKREIIGSDEHSPSRICWVRDGEEVNPLRALRLEILYQDGRDTSNYDRYAMQEVDEFVTACFTEHGCKEYLSQDGHNLRLPYIYACGSFRNNEYQLVRNWLAGIKWETE